MFSYRIILQALIEQSTTWSFVHKYEVFSLVLTILFPSSRDRISCRRRRILQPTHPPPLGPCTRLSLLGSVAQVLSLPRCLTQTSLHWPGQNHRYAMAPPLQPVHTGCFQASNPYEQFLWANKQAFTSSSHNKLTIHTGSIYLLSLQNPISEPLSVSLD